MCAKPVSRTSGPISDAETSAMSLSSRLWKTGQGWVHMAETEWSASRTVVIFFLILPFAIAASGILAGAISKDLFKILLDEDALFESLQVLLLIIAAILCLILSLKLRKEGRQLLSVLYLIGSVGLIFVVGEEISWGQRIFGWTTPESWDAQNRQGETTVHNLYGINQIFRWGQFLVALLGVVVPVVIYRSVSRENFVRNWSYFVPHVTLVPYFIVPLVWRSYRTFFPPSEEYYYAIARYNEAIELSIYIAIVLFFVYHFRVHRIGQEPAQ